MAVPELLRSPLLKYLPVLLMQNILMASVRKHLYRTINADLAGDDDAPKVGVVFHLHTADASRGEERPRWAKRR